MQYPAFTRQDALAHGDLLGYAADLDLDVPEFESTLADHQFAPQVLPDLEVGLQSGVQGTPTVFIIGHRYTGSSDFEPLLAALEQAGV